MVLVGIYLFYLGRDMRVRILPSLIGRQCHHQMPYAGRSPLSRWSFFAANFSVAGSPSRADSSHAVAALNAVLRVATTRRRANQHALLISGGDGDVSTLYEAAANELLAEDGLPRFLRWSLLADTISVFGHRARFLERRSSSGSINNVGNISSLDGSDGAKAALASSVTAAAISRAADLTRDAKTGFLPRDIFGLAQVVAAATQVREPCGELLAVALPRVRERLDSEGARTAVSLATLADLAAAAVVHEPRGGEGLALTSVWGLHRHLLRSLVEMSERATSEKWTADKSSRKATRARVGQSVVTACWALALGGALRADGSAEDAAIVSRGANLIAHLFKGEDEGVQDSLLARHTTAVRLHSVFAGVASAARAGRAPELQPLPPAISARFGSMRNWAQSNAKANAHAISLSLAVKDLAHRMGFPGLSFNFDAGDGVLIDVALSAGVAAEQNAGTWARSGFTGIALQLGDDAKLSPAERDYVRWLLAERGWATVFITRNEWATIEAQGVGGRERDDFFGKKFREALEGGIGSSLK